MVERAPGDREAPALDRVGEDDRRTLGLRPRLREGAEDVGEVVAAEILDRAGRPRPGTPARSRCEPRALVRAELVAAAPP